MRLPREEVPEQAALPDKALPLNKVLRVSGLL
jgi:hypothetical protein